MPATGDEAVRLSQLKNAFDEKQDALTFPLGLAYGGTGNTEGEAQTALALTNSRTIRTNLASNSTASFDGTANVTPGVTGTLSIANGGTGATTAAAARAALGLVGSDDFYVSSWADGIFAWGLIFAGGYYIAFTNGVVQVTGGNEHIRFASILQPVNVSTIIAASLTMLCGTNSAYELAAEARYSGYDPELGVFTIAITTPGGEEVVADGGDYHVNIVLFGEGTERT